MRSPSARAVRPRRRNRPPAEAVLARWPRPPRGVRPPESPPRPRRRPHPHVHIYYNSTTLDCTRKYRDFLGSARALRRLSDRICLEHDLSVIKNPRLHSKGKFRHYGQWLGAARPPSYKEQLRRIIDGALAERPADFAGFFQRMEAAGVQVKRGRGGVISFRLPGQDRATRFRASTLGDGYGPEDVEAVIGGPLSASLPRGGPVRRLPGASI